MLNASPISNSVSRLGTASSGASGPDRSLAASVCVQLRESDSSGSRKADDPAVERQEAFGDRSPEYDSVRQCENSVARRETYSSCSRWPLPALAAPGRPRTCNLQPRLKALPPAEFSRPAGKPHDPASFFFTYDQMDYYYRVPGEFTHRLTGDQYGFESLSFIITETHPGGGPGLHVHDVEEAHVLLEGTARYRIGDQTFTVQAPYVAKVPAGVPHTFINAGNATFNLVAVFASKHPSSTRVGPNPLVILNPGREKSDGFLP